MEISSDKIIMLIFHSSIDIFHYLGFVYFHNYCISYNFQVFYDKVNIIIHIYKWQNHIKVGKLAYKNYTAYT
jgi:hypothetical protein